MAFGLETIGIVQSYTEIVSIFLNFHFTQQHPLNFSKKGIDFQLL